MAVDHEAMENTPKLKGYYDNKNLVYKNAFWLIVGGGAAGFGLNAAQGLMPLHMDGVGMNAKQISLVMSMAGWIGMPLILYLSYLSDHWQWKMGRRLPFLMISLPFITIGMFFFPYMQTVLSCLLMYTIYSAPNSLSSCITTFLKNIAENSSD